MANRVAAFTQSDVKRFSKGIRQAGYDPVKIEVNQEGRIEATFAHVETAGDSRNENSWDKLIAKSCGRAVQA